MTRTAWLGNLCKRLLSTRRRRHSRRWAPERLEDRTLLSVASLLQGTELTVFSDADDDISVQATPDAFGVSQVEVVVNGVVNIDLVKVEASQLTALRIVGGPGANVIDLSAVRAEDFSFTDPVTGAGLQVLIEAGEGDDTILTTFDFDDSVSGGDGNDLINNTPRLPGDVFTMPPTQMATMLGTVPAAFQTQPLSIINGTDTAEFPSVGQLTDITGTVQGVGTLISPRHVLTAAHLVDGLAATDGRFQVGTSTFATQEIFIQPNFNAAALGTDAGNDIAVLLLDREVTDVIPSAIFRDVPAVGEFLTLVGFGEGGDGTTGADGMPGTKRVGDSAIDLVSPTLLVRDFDDDTESNTAPGDDGAPGFLNENGRLLVAGVFSTSTQANAAIGDRAFDSRVDNYAAWIDSIVAVIFPPNPLGNLVLDGGDGDDTINGGDGNDSLLGGDGNDLLVPWFGDDTILAGDGDDSLDAERGNDVIDMGDGIDIALGGDGNDTINGGEGNDSLVGGNGNDSILGGAGDDFVQADGGNGLSTPGDDTVLGNAGNDSIVGGGGLDLLNGGSGNDVIDSGDQVLTVGNVIVDPEGNQGEFNVATFTLSLSRPSIIPVTVDVRTVEAEALAGLDFVALSSTVTFNPGETTRTVDVQIIGDNEPELNERFILELSNSTSAALGNDTGVATIVDDGDGPIQTVFLDFDSGTDFFEHFYTVAERDGIQARLEADYTPFNYVFTQQRPFFGAFTTILFNELPFPLPGLIGIALDGIDFRNLNQGDTVFVDAAVAINLLGAPPSAANFISVSANVGAHELGHSVGLRHGDAFGPVGQGVIPAIQPLFNPPFPGPVNATETNRHIMATPAIGQPLTDILGDSFFGARESIKLSLFSFRGQVTPEGMGVHNTIGTAQLVNMADLPVPNLEETGPLVGLDFDVAANVLTGELNTVGESDFYAFDLERGENLYIEIISDVLNTLSVPRFPSTIDSIINVFDDAGNLIPYFTSTAMNDDEWEGTTDSLILDLQIPDDGRFFIEVSSASGMDLGNYELLTYTFDANPAVDLTGIVNTFPPSQATILGGGGNDMLSGSDGADVLSGGSGADLIAGNAGNDSVFAGSGEDTVQGGDDNDVILGQGGDDTLEGGNGDDFVNGGAGTDRVFGDDSLGLTSGNDTLSGGARNDALFGGAGNDVIFGGAGGDTIDGGDDDDTLFGQGGADIVNGGSGNDSIVWRTDGDDTVDGGEGRDAVEVRGTNRTDRFLISQDVTTLQITEGNSTLNIGRDEAVVANTTETVIINARGGFDRIDIETIDNVGGIHILVDAGSGNDVVNGAGARVGNVRLIIDGGTGADTLTGTGDGDLIFGRDGTDLIFGRGGNDTLFGGDDSDTLDGQAGDDLLLGEERNDVLRGGSGNDSADGSTGNDTLDGGEGNDTLTGGFGRDVVNGMDGDDLLTGNDGADRVLGGTGNDTLDGGNHNDTLVGQGGDDSLFGDDGDDFINGNDGDDSIDGGDGNDTIMGGMGDDFIAGNDGDDLINGQSGADIIVGGDGRDSIQGGSGNDILFGNLGNDGLSGNAGSDTIDAGEGIDSINNPEARDRIFDDGREFTLTAALRELFQLISQ